MNAGTGVRPETGNRSDASNLLDQSVAVTFFHDSAAQGWRAGGSPPSALSRSGSRPPRRRRRNGLPWLKLAPFGDMRRAKGSLRHDANVLAITGVEADYDGGNMPFAEGGGGRG